MAHFIVDNFLSMFLNNGIVE